MKSRAITLKIGATTYYKKWDDTQNIWLIQLKTECLRQSRFHFLGNRALTFACPRASSDIASILSISKSKKWPGSNSMGLLAMNGRVEIWITSCLVWTIARWRYEVFFGSYIFKSGFFQNPMFHTCSQDWYPWSTSFIIYHFLRDPQVQHQAKHLNFGRHHVILAKIPGNT